MGPPSPSKPARLEVTYVIVLARLTRIYERKDVAGALSKVTKKQAMSRVMRWGRKRKPDEQPRDEILELPEDNANGEDELAGVTAVGDDAPAPESLSKQAKRPVVVKPIGVIR